MKISTLINDLNRVITNEGDLRVAIDDYELGRLYNISLEVVDERGTKVLTIGEAMYQGN